MDPHPPLKPPAPVHVHHHRHHATYRHLHALSALLNTSHQSSPSSTPYMAALAATEVDLPNILDCDINDFEIIEALDLDLSSATDDEQVGDLDYGNIVDILCKADLDLSSADDNLADLDILDFLIIDALDLDLSSADGNKFRGGSAGYSAVFSDADTVSHCRHICEDFDDSGAAATCAWLLAGLGDYNNCCDGAAEEVVYSPSAESGVTDNGSLTPSPGHTAAAEAMERFLLEDDDEQAELDQGLLSVVDEYFAGDDQMSTAEVVSAAGHFEPTDDVEEEESGVILAAQEHEQSSSRKRAKHE